MKSRKSLSWLLAFLVFGTLASIGLESGAFAAPGAEDAAAGGMMAFGCICWVVIMLIAFAVPVGLAYFVYSDAQKNGVENGILWALITFITWPIGLLVYFLGKFPCFPERNRYQNSA